MNKVFTLYRKFSLTIQLYVKIRVKIAGFLHIIKFVPHSGSVLDIGCGYGILSNIIALEFPNIKILGTDYSAKRIAIAQKTIGTRKNIDFLHVDAAQFFLPKKFDAVILYDLLHHIKKKDQIKILENIFLMLKPKGMILIKEIDLYPRWKYYMNFLHDRLFNGGPLNYRSGEMWQMQLKKFGFASKVYRFNSLYPHVLIVGNKKK